MAYEDDEDLSGDDGSDISDDDSDSSGTGAYAGASPLSLLSLSDPYTTREAQDYSRKILKKTIDNPDDEEAPYFAKLKANAETTRAALRAARERIAAESYDKGEKWLAAAAAFGQPTKTGSMGETLGNVAGAIIEPRRREREFGYKKNDALTQIDLGMAGVDDQLTKAQLQLMIAKQTRNGAMAREALKILGKQLPPDKQAAKNDQQNINNVNRAFSKDYVSFIQTGASDSAKALEDLGIARDKLRGYKIDPETGQKVKVGKGKNDKLTGPVVGTLSNLPWVGKTIQDTMFPDSANTQETVEYQIQRSLRPILGAQFTKEEGERLIARVYNPRLSEEINADRLDRLIKQLQRAYQAKIAAANYFEKNNYSMKGFRGKKSWTVDDLWPADGSLPKNDPAADNTPPPSRGTGGRRNFLPDDEELSYEDLIPAGEEDPYIKPQAHAEGGQVSSPDPNDPDRVRYRMPDGRVIGAPKGAPYEAVLARYAAASHQHFDTPKPDPAAPAAPAQAQDDSQPDQSGGFNLDIPTTIGLGASVAGHGILGAIGGRLGYGTLMKGIDLAPGYKSTPAQEKVLSALEAEGLHPSDWAALVKQANKYGVPTTGIDVGDYGALRGLGDSAMTPGNPETTALYKSTVKRQAGARDRVEGQVNKALAPDEYFQKMKDLKSELNTNSDPMYRELEKNFPYLKSDALMQMMSTPSGKQAVKDAVKAIRDKPGATLGKQDAMGMVTKPSIEFLDQVKQSLDDMIMKEEGTGPNYQPTGKGRRLRKLRNSLRDEVDRLTTDPKTGVSAYKEARSQYAGDIEIMDAMRLGREDFLKKQPQELAPLIQGMSFSEKDALRTGVAQRLFETIRGNGGKGNIASKIIDAPDMQERLKLLFDNPNQYKVFAEALKAESKNYDNSRSTIAAGRRAQTMSQTDPSIAKKVVKDAPTLGIKSPVQWVLRAIRRSPQMDKKDAAQIIQMLNTSNPKEIDKIAANLAPKVGRTAFRKSMKGKAGYAGAAIGAIYPLAKKYFSNDDEESDDTDEPVAKARGGLVRKPEWQRVSEQVLNQSMFGVDDLISHTRKV